MHWIVAIICSCSLVAAEGSPYLKAFFLGRKTAGEESCSIRIDRSKLELIAEQVWYNECGGRMQSLVCWNEGEEFPSLGIGHFIWHPEGEAVPFCETFPELIAFLDANGAEIPQWLQEAPHAPWKTRDEFLQDTVRLDELRHFLYETRALQAEFMVQRLERALPRMVDSLPPDEQLHVISRFHRVKSEPRGVYALLDYLNFKGDGVSESERYQGEGWGLLQVLQMMNPGTGLDEFARCAQEVLRVRVSNAPPERNEERWLAGWEYRVGTYSSTS